MYEFRREMIRILSVLFQFASIRPNVALKIKLRLFTLFTYQFMSTCFDVINLTPFEV